MKTAMGFRRNASTTTALFTAIQRRTVRGDLKSEPPVPLSSYVKPDTRHNSCGLRTILISVSSCPEQSPRSPSAAQVCDNDLHGLFCFPRTNGVRSTEPRTDVDYSIRAY